MMWSTALTADDDGRPRSGTGGRGHIIAVGAPAVGEVARYSRQSATADVYAIFKRVVRSEGRGDAVPAARCVALSVLFASDT